MQSDFLEFANPTFDLRTLTAQRRRDTRTHTPISLVSLMALPMREVLVIQPPLAPNERLPRSFLIDHQDPALSTEELPEYFYAQGLDLYVHPRHRAMYDLVCGELYDSTYKTTHGTNTTGHQGCTGPLCRRIRNISRYAAARLRDARQTRVRYTHEQMMRDRYTSLQRCQPIYAAVEPLLEALTLWSHEINRPTQPNQLSEIYLKLIFSRQTRHDWLRRLYAETTNISGVS